MNKTFQTKHGLFTVNPNDSIAMSLIENNGHQEELLNIVLRLVNDSTIVFDIGAHIGTFSIPLAKHAARVVSIEPVDNTFNLLTKNITDNLLSHKISAVKAMLGVGNEPRVLELCGINSGGNNFRQKGKDGIIPMTLDSLCSHLNMYPDVIKMDVEGMEADVLQGAPTVLQRNPIIVLEIFVLNPFRKLHCSRKLKELNAIFEGHGYCFYAIVNGRLVPIKSFTSLKPYIGLFTDVLCMPYAMPKHIEFFRTHLTLTKHSLNGIIKHIIHSI